MNSSEHLTGTIERILFHSKETGYSILRVNQETADSITVLGHVTNIREGEMIKCAGTWTTHEKHGRQFKAGRIEIRTPTNGAGLERLLNSGIFEGIGQHFAKLLVEKFGDRLIEIVEKYPHRLEIVPGLGKKRRSRIVNSWMAYKKKHEGDFQARTFLFGLGLNQRNVERVLKKYGDETITKVQANPYVLAGEFSGIGFLTADKYARSLNIPGDAPVRIRAAIKYVVYHASEFGHCMYPVDKIVNGAEKLLNQPDELVRSHIDAAVKAYRLVKEETESGSVVFKRSLHEAERTVASQIKRLVENSPITALDSDRLMSFKDAAVNGLVLSPSQERALATALSSKVAIICGGPGVGKTTLLSALVNCCALSGARVSLAAPTGKAANRMAAATGQDALTIHRLLGSNGLGDFERNEHNPLDVDVVFIDEASMVDVSLMAALLRALPASVKLVLIGDNDQLPSVGPGNVLGDLIESNAIPVAILTEIHRQAAGSAIITNAHAIRNGNLPEILSIGDFQIRLCDKDGMLESVLKYVCEEAPRDGYDPIRDVQVLASMRKGQVGIVNLNSVLQDRLNSVGNPTPSAVVQDLRVGDKVIHTRNRQINGRDVFNGTVGFVSAVDPAKHTVIVEFDDGMVTYDKSCISDLELFYAGTVHRAQGSEFPVVVMPLPPEHYILADRRLLYTAVTRARKKVITFTDERTLRAVIKSTRSSMRYTRLRSRLTSELLGL